MANDEQMLVGGIQREIIETLRKQGANLPQKELSAVMTRK
jgi:hypothetical protein